MKKEIKKEIYSNLAAVGVSFAGDDHAKQNGLSLEVKRDLRICVVGDIRRVKFSARPDGWEETRCKTGNAYSRTFAINRTGEYSTRRKFHVQWPIETFDWNVW